jgi:hypothetical protein
MKVNHVFQRTALFMLALVALTATGCEKDAVAEATEQAQIPPVASFKKQVSLDQADGKSILLEVGATDQALLDQLNASSFTVDLNAPATEAVDESHEHAKADPALTTLPSRHITVQVLGADADQEISSYTINFSDGLKDLMRREKVALRIKATPAAYEPAAKTAGHWHRTPYCAKVTAYGDGGQIQTGVSVYRAYLYGNTWYQAHLHTFYFYYNATCTRCAHGVSYIDDVWVFQDVCNGVYFSYSC